MLGCCFATCHARPQDVGCNIVIPRSGAPWAPPIALSRAISVSVLRLALVSARIKANRFCLTWNLLAIQRHVPETQRKSTGRHVAQFQQRACVVKATRLLTGCSQLPCTPFVSLERHIRVEADQSRSDKFTGAHQDWQILEQ